MNCCACLLLYALLLSCSDACGLKVGMSPGPAFGRITSRNNLLNGIASGIGPGPHQCSHRKTKGTVLSNGLFQGTTAVSVLASAGALPGVIASQTNARCKVPFPQQMAQAKRGALQELGYKYSMRTEFHKLMNLLACAL